MPGLDGSVLGSLAAEMLDELEGEPELLITAAMVVVETYNPQTQEHVIGYRCSDPRGWFHAAFLEQAVEVARAD